MEELNITNSISTEKSSQESETDKIKFTQEQQNYVDKLISSEIAKLQVKTEKRINEIKEAERLKSLSEDERCKAELESYKQRVAEYEKQNLVNQVKVMLSEKGLPSKYAEIISVENSDMATSAIQFLSDYVSEIKSAYDKKISELELQLKNSELRGEIPKTVTPSIIEDGVSAKFKELNPKIKI